MISSYNFNKISAEKLESEELTIVRSVLTTPNSLNTSTKYGEYCTPDNIFAKMKYIIIRRKGLSTSGWMKCFQELELFSKFVLSIKKKKCLNKFE